MAISPEVCAPGCFSFFSGSCEMIGLMSDMDQARERGEDRMDPGCREEQRGTWTDVFSADRILCYNTLDCSMEEKDCM